MTGKNLLFGSASLTAEEEALRAELMAWCQAKFDHGTRPIPVQAALTWSQTLYRTLGGKAVSGVLIQNERKCYGQRLDSMEFRLPGLGGQTEIRALSRA